MIPLLLAQEAQASGTLVLLAFVLLGVSVILLALEMFVPSGGLIGVLAGIAGIGSIIFFFRYDTTWGVVASAVYLILGPIIGIFMFKLWLHSPVAKGMILGGREPGALEEDESASDPMSAEHARRERLAQLRQLIGARGVAVTALRPVGTIRINGQRVDALAESGVIDAGTPIVVADVHDNQIKVRPEA
jgi:membrane-bound ClpP family serine protease